MRCRGFGMVMAQAREAGLIEDWADRHDIL